MKVGKLIRKQRLQIGYSQEYMAMELGISSKTYINIENDKSKIDLERFIQLSKILEINPIGFLQDHLQLSDFCEKQNEYNDYCKKEIHNKYEKALRKRDIIIRYLEMKLNLN